MCNISEDQTLAQENVPDNTCPVPRLEWTTGKNSPRGGRTFIHTIFLGKPTSVLDFLKRDVLLLQGGKRALRFPSTVTSVGGAEVSGSISLDIIVGAALLS